MPSWYWSSTARVIDPAHLDEDTPVKARLRSARHRRGPCDLSGPTESAPLAAPVYRPEKRPHFGQRLRFLRSATYSSSDSDPCRGCRHYRVLDLAHAHILARGTDRYIAPCCAAGSPVIRRSVVYRARL